MFFDNYDMSLFVSVKAFLPSLRVLKTSQERKKMIRMISVTREITFISISLINLLDFFQNLSFEFNRTSNF